MSLEDDKQLFNSSTNYNQANKETDNYLRQTLRNIRYDISPANYTHLPKYINNLLFGEYINEWIMQHEERTALILLLSKIKPECAIQIGTGRGGSLSAISKFSKKVYSLDIDLTCSERLEGRLLNIEFIVGPSQKTLPSLLQKLQETSVNLEFVLIDGCHSREAVKQDIENLLQFQPTYPLYVVIHDSFMPYTRQGIVEANWEANPYVHFVELDFIPGRLEPDNRMTCGFTLALMLPFKRSGNLNIHAERESIYQLFLKHSTHRPKKPWERVFLRLKKNIKELFNVFK